MRDMMDNFDGFMSELMRFVKAEEPLALLVVSTIALVLVVAIVRRLIRVRIVGRLQSAVAAYAEREMEKQQSLRERQFETSGARK